LVPAQLELRRGKKKPLVPKRKGEKEGKSTGRGKKKGSPTRPCPQGNSLFRPEKKEGEKILSGVREKEKKREGPPSSKGEKKKRGTHVAAFAH